MASEFGVDDFVESFGSEPKYRSDFRDDLDQLLVIPSMEQNSYSHHMNPRPGIGSLVDPLGKELDELEIGNGKGVKYGEPTVLQDENHGHLNTDNFTPSHHPHAGGVDENLQQSGSFNYHSKQFDYPNGQSVDTSIKLDLPFDDQISSRNVGVSADPVINIVAPDELSSSKHFQDQAYPMYSVDGQPIENSQVHEFMKGVSEFDESNGLSLDSINGAQSVLTPYGTPLSSPFVVPGSPNTIISPEPSILGSPHAQDWQSSSQFANEPFIDEDIGSFVDDAISDASDQFEAFGIQFGENDLAQLPPPYQNPSFQYRQNQDLGRNLANNYLSVPRNKTRTLSDPWSDRERAAFLENIEFQTQQAPEKYSGVTDQHSSQLSFPSYTPINLVSHNSAVNMQPDSGTQQFLSLNGHRSMEGIDGSNFRGIASQSNSPTNSLTPGNTRARSHSNPYESTNELKTSSQLFSCELCNKRFTRAYNLRSHMRTHTDERPFSCQFCGKSFARQHDRKRHEALHSGEKKFVCHGNTHDFQWGCRKRFARADALGRHFRTEAGKTCLRPLVDQIYNNGNNKEKAPEGILYSGMVDNQPQFAFNIPERDVSSNLTTEEREEQARRTVIVTAVAEILSEVMEQSNRQ